jgi:transcriptional regulator with XRE-family HTH domain
MAGVRHLGVYIRDQRRDSNVSLRQLAKLAGVSNPYLSQIERGLRKPSAEILQQIAKALRISAEALYIQAGILEQREGSRFVADAVHADEALNERQKQVLLEIYESFRKENAGLAAVQPGSPEPLAAVTDSARPTAVKAAAKKPAARKASPKKSVPTTSTTTAAGGTA